jgi:hypothetical protein
MHFTKVLRNGLSAAVTLGLLGYVLAGEWDSVRAYTTEGGTYPSGVATYYVNPNFTDASAGTPAQQIAALQNAADAWHAQAAVPFAFQYGGTTSVATVAFDGINSVFYSNTDGGGALAVTYYWMGGASMMQFDIEFFDRDGTYNFVWATTPTLSQFDIQSVATHEFGHALGLGHSATIGATMYPSVAPGDMGNRSLAPDDIAGAQALYGGVQPDPVVTSCAPLSAFIDGGTTVTITGQNFTGSSLVIRFAGQVASNPVFISPTQVSCTAPASTQSGVVPVDVCCNGHCGTASVFTYNTIRMLNAPVFGGVSGIEFHVPTMANRVYQAYGSLGTAGIPLSSWLSPLDQRILPLTYDAVLLWNLHASPSWFVNFYGQLNAQGSATGFFQVPNIPQIHGTTFHFAFIVWDPAAPVSGVSHVSSQLAATIP